MIAGLRRLLVKGAKGFMHRISFPLGRRAHNHTEQTGVKKRKIALLCSVFILLVLAISTAAPVAACPWHKSMKLFGQWAPSPNGEWPDDLALWAELHGAVDENSAIAVPVDAPASAVGVWEAPEDWPVIAIHMAVLPTGKVLAYSYPRGGAGANAQIWDPATREFEDVSLSEDIFCSGLSILGDGHLYATGGNQEGWCGYQGLFVTHTLDPELMEWTRRDDMQEARWYPQNVSLADGSVAIFSGLDRTCTHTPVMELYDPATDSLTVIPEGEIDHNLYPRMHLLSDGRIVRVGPNRDTYVFTFGSGWEYLATTVHGGTYDGTTVKVPGKVDELMLIGGSAAFPRKTAERIDMTVESPAWVATADMNFERSHADALILPDRRILMMGGGTLDLYGSPVLNPEIYDPDTETWTVLPAGVFPRMYHATTVLLPDGRVLTAGQDNGAGAFTAEIYEPDYLFRGPRPVIDSAPEEMYYGQAFEIETANAADIEEVALVKLSTVTHSVNSGQRYVGLETRMADSGTLNVFTPQHGNLAPPGYYMLFLVDGDGVPSESTMVKLGPAVLELEVTAMQLGQPATMTVTGAEPGESVYFGVGLGGIGPGSCPQVMGGTCLDILPSMQQLGSVAADGEGKAEMIIDVPPNGALLEVGVQAMAIRGPDGSETVKTNAVLRQVEP